MELMKTMMQMRQLSEKIKQMYLNAVHVGVAKMLLKMKMRSWSVEFVNSGFTSSARASLKQSTNISREAPK